jgi:3-hydroxyisobutyrate dehydrogenase
MEMDTKTPTSIAFLGTGTLGSTMVLRLLSQGIGVTVWNRTPGRLSALTAAGATAATTPRDAAAAAAMVALCLTDAAAVEQVVFGPEGVAEAARAPGSSPRLLIDFSTIGRNASRRLATRLARMSGAHWLDSPVSGGVRGAATGTLIAFCGGAPADFERASPVLRAVAQRAERVGDVGAGQSVKFCNQLIVATTLLAIAESIALARASDVDAAALPAMLADGLADSALLRSFGRRMATGQSEPRTGAIGTMLKDVEGIVSTAEEAALSVPLLMEVRRIYSARCARGCAHEDLVTLAAQDV